MIEPERHNLETRDRPKDPTEPRPAPKPDPDHPQPDDPETTPDVHGDPEPPA